MAELIPPGITASAWVDVTVVAGSPKALFLKGAAANATVPSGINFEIAHKVGNDDYAVFGVLNSSNIAQQGGLSYPGTYGVRRLLATGAGAGMDVEG